MNINKKTKNSIYKVRVQPGAKPETLLSWETTANLCQS